MQRAKRRRDRADINKKSSSGPDPGCARTREASMNKTAEFAAGVAVDALRGEASAAIDASLLSAVERRDVPGVVALVTDRDNVLYRGAFGVADVATGRPLN